MAYNCGGIHSQSGLRLTFWNLARCVLHCGMLYHQFCSYLSGKQKKNNKNNKTNLTKGYTLCDVNTEDTIRYDIALMTSTSRVYIPYPLGTIIK